MSMKKRWFALFTVPLFFVFIVVVIVPFLTGVYYSFVSWRHSDLSENSGSHKAREPPNKPYF